MNDRKPIPVRELFVGFAELGLVSFGGAAAWARRLLVDKRRWLDADDFNEILGIGQVLPGPNVVNASVVIGSREAGVLGALAALSGILLPPLAIVLVLVSVFARFGDAPIVHAALRGSALAGAGIVLANGCAMAQRLRDNALGIGLAIAACAMLAFSHFPLPLILAIVVPIGIALVVLRDRARA